MLDLQSEGHRSRKKVWNYNYNIPDWEFALGQEYFFAKNKR